MKKLLIHSILLLTTPSFAGIYEPNVLWKNNEVRVCFYDHESQLAGSFLEDPSNRPRLNHYDAVPVGAFAASTIRRSVEANFSRDTTGIYFTGWKPCSSMKSYDAVIIGARFKRRWFWEAPIRDDFVGMGSIGMDGKGEGDYYEGRSYWRTSGLRPGILLNLKDVNSGTLSQTVVHEFGHLAGLRHEHAHKKARDDKRCQTSKVFISELLGTTAIEFTPYDPDSIMNYCRERRAGMAYLSEWDIQTLRSMY